MQIICLKIRISRFPYLIKSNQKGKLYVKILSCYNRTTFVANLYLSCKEYLLYLLEPANPKKEKSTNVNEMIFGLLYLRLKNGVGV